MIEFSYTWTISTDDIFIRPVESIMSPIFPPRAADKFKWRLHLYPRGYPKGFHPSGIMTVCLEYVSGTKNEVEAMYKFSIMNGHKQEIFRKSSDTFPIAKLISAFSFPNSFFITLNYVPDPAELTIICEVKMINDNHNDSNQPNAVQIQELQNDLRLMLDNQRLSDVTFSVAGKEFQAHKAILVARSPVFQAMFELEMAEKKTNLVNITDIDHGIFQEMLRFIYTGEVLNIENIASDLLVVADKYALVGLKAMCEDVLCNSNLSVESVAEILIFADMQKLNKLKDRAIAFINKHAKEFMKTPGWKFIAQSHPEILADLYGAMALR